jgi:Major capsid protein Gp23
MANVITEKATSKWLRIKDALCDGLAPKRAKQLGHVLENTRKEFVNRQKYLMENASASAVSTGNIATLNKVILPIIRRVLPNVIANELVGVQPMPGPVAQIMTLRYVYGTTSTGAQTIAGEEMLAPLHVRDLAAAYSGNEVAATPAGALTAQLEGVPGNAVKLEMLKQVVEAKSRRLSARWTVEAQTDAQNQYGVDVEEELLAAVAQDITVEIDQEILRSLRSLPPTPTAANTFDQSAVSGQATSVVDEFAALAVLIGREANRIAVRTRRGKGNWAVVSPTILTVLESARASAFARTTEGSFDAPTNNKYVGTLNNSMRVYVDNYSDDDTPVLIGYKGSSEVDAATFYCPYVPLTTHGVVTDPNTFELVTSFYTRYGYVEFVNSATSLGNSADYLGLVGINAATLSFL